MSFKSLCWVRKSNQRPWCRCKPKKNCFQIRIDETDKPFTEIFVKNHYFKVWISPLPKQIMTSALSQDSAKSKSNYNSLYRALSLIFMLIGKQNGSKTVDRECKTLHFWIKMRSFIRKTLNSSRRLEPEQTGLKRYLGNPLHIPLPT